MDPKEKNKSKGSEYGSNQQQSSLMRKCVSKLVSTYISYSTKSFDKCTMKIGMHSRIYTETMK